MCIAYLFSVVDLPDDGFPTKPMRGSRGIAGSEHGHEGRLRVACLHYLDPGAESPHLIGLNYPWAKAEEASAVPPCLPPGLNDMTDKNAAVHLLMAILSEDSDMYIQCFLGLTLSSLFIESSTFLLITSCDFSHYHFTRHSPGRPRYTKTSMTYGTKKVSAGNTVTKFASQLGSSR